jgi:hypothetical protein
MVGLNMRVGLVRHFRVSEPMPSGWLTALELQERQVADLVESSDEEVLVVSHAGMMAYLRRELVGRGFAGPKFRLAEHGRLYVFERKSEGRSAKSELTRKRGIPTG